MYVCSCKVITDHQIRCIARGGMTTWKSLVRRTRVGTGCGTCAKFAKQIFDEAVQQTAQSTQAARDAAASEASATPADLSKLCSGNCGQPSCAVIKTSDDAE